MICSTNLTCGSFSIISNRKLQEAKLPYYHKSQIDHISNTIYYILYVTIYFLLNVNVMHDVFAVTQNRKILWWLVTIKGFVRPCLTITRQSISIVCRWATWEPASAIWDNTVCIGFQLIIFGCRSPAFFFAGWKNPAAKIDACTRLKYDEHTAHSFVKSLWHFRQLYVCAPFNLQNLMRIHATLSVTQNSCIFTCDTRPTREGRRT